MATLPRRGVFAAAAAMLEIPGSIQASSRYRDRSDEGYHSKYNFHHKPLHQCNALYLSSRMVGVVTID